MYVGLDQDKKQKCLKYERKTILVYEIIIIINCVRPILRRLMC